MPGSVTRCVQGRLGTVPYRGPELLLDLAQRLAQTLIDECGMSSEVAYRVAIKGVQEVSFAYGGGHIYFPLPRHGKSRLSWFELKARDLEIYRAYNGRNGPAICKRYKISRDRLRQILKQVRLERQAELLSQAGGEYPGELPAEAVNGPPEEAP
jgi:Mor family transcriptional regulator